MDFGIPPPGVVYCGGVVCTVPTVIKWVIVWDFRLLPLRVVYCRGVLTRGADSSGYKRVLLPYSRHPGSWGGVKNGCDSSGCKFSPPHSRQAARRVRASTSGAVADTSAGTGTVVRTAAADAVAGMLTGPAVKASAPGGTDVVCARRPKKRRDRAWNRSSCLSRRHVSPVAMDHACTTALYLLHLHAAGFHTVSCGTFAHPVCCCCCAVPVPVLVLLIAARFHPR